MLITANERESAVLAVAMKIMQLILLIAFLTHSVASARHIMSTYEFDYQQNDSIVDNKEQKRESVLR